MGNQDRHIGVIGAGMAGLSCATRLAEHGLSVTVFDKGRGPGGRMAARRAEVGGQVVSFDHGTQAFVAESSQFQSAVDYWQCNGHADRWPAAGEGAYVGVPGMNGPLRAMAEPLAVRWGDRAEQVIQTDGGWLVQTPAGEHEFSDLAIAVPAEQAAVLLNEVAPTLAEIAGKIQSDPCWTIMVSFADHLPVHADCLEAADSTALIRWAARNSAKPQRSGIENWVIQAGADYSRSILELEADVAAAQILESFFNQNEIAPVQPMHLVAHRWRYAFPVISDQQTPDEIARWDAQMRVGVCGDYLSAPNVEGAWLSGRALADHILR
jgi:predicted NAD/FAD-dependent oxidoreductase